MKKFKTQIIACIPMLALFFVGTNNVQAQDEKDDYKMVEFGIRLMPTYSNFNVNNSSGGNVSGNVRMGFGAGAFLGIHLSKHVAIQPEIIYSSINQQSYDANMERRINLRYVNVPLLLALNTNKSKVINFNAVAGPQVGFNVGSSITLIGNGSANDPQPILSVRKNDFGLAYGLGLDVGLNSTRNIRLGFGYRGVLGLIDIGSRNNSSNTNSYYILDKSKIRTNAVYVGLSVLFL